MTKKEFIKKAESEKANFELHKRLIEYHLCDREDKNYSNDLKEFAEKQVVDGNLLLSLMEYAEAYYEERIKSSQHTIISSDYIKDLEERCRKANFAPFDDRFPSDNSEFEWDEHTIEIAENWLKNK
jgi:hypothetical protein